MRDIIGTKIKGRLVLREGTSPMFMEMAHPIPYSLQEKVEGEIERMVQEGALNPVTWSESPSPVAVAPKADTQGS